VEHPFGELVAAVAASPLAVVAANEHGQIVAASRAALEFLGYADPAELVGRRLTSLVPERYRQAHVAGMTLHMTNGRAALVGVGVDVPVLCADDTETSARLTVDVSSGEGHHRLFVGRLEPAS
jgi:PAS domain S-box-containing protein